MTCWLSHKQEQKCHTTIIHKALKTVARPTKMASEGTELTSPLLYISGGCKVGWHLQVLLHPHLVSCSLSSTDLTSLCGKQAALKQIERSCSHCLPTINNPHRFLTARNIVTDILKPHHQFDQLFSAAEALSSEFTNLNLFHFYCHNFNMKFLKFFFIECNII